MIPAPVLARAVEAILVAQNASEGDAEQWEATLLATVALEAAGTEARWQALKDWLGERIDADEKVRQGMAAEGNYELEAAPFGGLVSANRSTLAKMRELEGLSDAVHVARPGD